MGPGPSFSIFCVCAVMRAHAPGARVFVVVSRVAGPIETLSLSLVFSCRGEHCLSPQSSISIHFLLRKTFDIGAPENVQKNEPNSRRLFCPRFGPYVRMIDSLMAPGKFLSSLQKYHKCCCLRRNSNSVLSALHFSSNLIHQTFLVLP